MIDMHIDISKTQFRNASVLPSRVLLTIGGCNYSVNASPQARPGSRLSIISRITEWPLDLCSYSILLVVSAVDEAPSAPGAFGAFRPLAPKETPTAGVIGCLVLLAFPTKTEENSCN
jgi:hypothetical protein